MRYSELAEVDRPNRHRPRSLIKPITPKVDDRPDEYQTPELEKLQKWFLKKATFTAEKIKADSQPFLEESGGKYLFRGTDTGGTYLFFKKKIRKNRYPMSSSSEMHKMFNWMIKKAGRKANRSNSIFTSSKRYVASGYGEGDPFYVFPIGKFNYTWHRMAGDWYSFFPFDLNKEFIKGDPDYVNESIHNIKGDDGTLQKAIRSGHEIMISSINAYYVHEAFFKDLVHPILVGKKPIIKYLKDTTVMHDRYNLDYLD